MSAPDHNAPAEASAAEAPVCPKCQGPMWDNRTSKRNPRAPDFKCKDRACEGVIWPPRESVPAGAPGAAPASGAGPSCPICGGPMWDDRASKRNPRAPDYRCKDRPKTRGGPGCEGVIWPPRDGQPRAATPTRAAAPARRPAAAPAPPPDLDYGPPHDDDDLPF